MRGTGFILMIILAVTALSGCASQSENTEQIDMAVKPTPTPILSPEEKTAALQEQPGVIEVITVGGSQVALRQGEEQGSVEFVLYREGKEELLACIGGDRLDISKCHIEPFDGEILGYEGFYLFERDAKEQVTKRYKLDKKSLQKIIMEKPALFYNSDNLNDLRNYDSEETEEGETENEQAHKAYIQALKENDYDKTPELCLADPSCYAFYDIDGNGVDELIVCDGYFAICFFTYQDEKVLSSPVVYLSHEKYGGRFRLYPEKKMIELPEGGHMDHYYGWFIRVNGTKAKCVAEKDWTVHFLSDTETKTTYKYKISGKRVTKEKYQKYVREIKATKMVKRKDLKWSKVSALREE